MNKCLIRIHLLDHVFLCSTNDLKPLITVVTAQSGNYSVYTNVSITCTRLWIIYQPFDELSLFCFPNCIHII